MTEVKDVVAPADAAAKAAAAALEVSNEKMGELLQPKVEPKMVPESALLEFKNENTAFRKELNRMQDLILATSTQKEVESIAKDIAKKYPTVSEAFITDMVSALRKEGTPAKKVDEPAAVVAPKAEENKDKDSTAEAERIDKIFKSHYAKTLDALPQFKDVADSDVIKALTLDPANREKTLAQILEKAYGHLVKGKSKSIDAAQPGGKDPAEIDYEKASKDTDYFKEIMSDPARKKEYNANLFKRLKL